MVRDGGEIASNIREEGFGGRTAKLAAGRMRGISVGGGGGGGEDTGGRGGGGGDEEGHLHHGLHCWLDVWSEKKPTLSCFLNCLHT